VQTCSACGQENPDGFRLCGMCGTALVADAQAAREERKVVTVLFTDLVGSTAAAERLDPEDVRKILSPYYARLRSEIERHGGTVEKFIGDAVMAVFGAPVAHEDDPERAVRAALAIRDALADGDLQIRTAVNTGEALVALGARPVEGEGMVSGDVVNTAARLQSAAPVNGILVGETTYRATRHTIDYRDAPAVEAKGKAEPVRVWEVVGAHSAFGSDVEEKLRTPLVGRVRERGLLADALARVRTEESVQLVTLVGVPGIGKSRLVAELFNVVDADPDLISWRQGRSLPYGESVSFWALGEIVKSHAGILESDDADTAAAKLASTIDSLVEDEQERAWLTVRAHPLIGLDVDERTDRGEAFAAWRRLLEAAAEQRPLVLVFEDLHWADDGLLDFVDHLADWATTAPMLIVGTARPELLDRRPNWGGGKRNAFTLSLGALSDTETAQLLHNLLDRAVLPAELQQAVLARAEGNPLYAAEYVRMLEEHEDGDLPLPDTVQGLIAARIDGLPPSEKALLQDAAVLGKVFWPGAIGSADPSTLHALERKEFVRRDRRSAIAGELQYAFLHALVRDVAYGQIPRAERVERHVRAAEWLHALPEDRSEDRADLLAHHYREALALAGAAGIDASRLRGPAKEALAAASERALALNAWQSALDLAREALTLTDETDDVRPVLQLRIAQAGVSVDEIEYDLALEARDTFLAGGDIERAAEAEILLSQIAYIVGLGGTDHAKRAVDLLADQPPSELYASALARLARRLALAAEPAEAMLLARQALALAEQLGADRTASDALNTLGMAKVQLGDEDGLQDLREAVLRGEQATAPDETAKALNNLMQTCMWAGRLDEAERSLWTHREISRRYGLTAALRWTAGDDAYVATARGQLRHVEELVADALANLAESNQFERTANRACRSIARAARGDLQGAMEDSDISYAEALGSGDPKLLAVCSDRAVVLFLAGRTDEALDAIDELLREPRALDPSAFAVLVAAELGRPDRIQTLHARFPEQNLWRRAAIALAEGEPARAAEIYAEIGCRFAESWARLLAAERGDLPQLEPARAYFEQEGATAFLRRCDTLLSASA
jgi:class 3 adenylate cyclase/tetratricopeptide (TPR) repeat protein